MKGNKTLLITYDNQSKEININTSKCTYEMLYLTIKNEFSLAANINIYTSDTNTKLNETNCNDLILNSYEQSIEIYLQIATIICKPTVNMTSNNYNKDKCSLCLNRIIKCKYVCTICDNYILCEQCEFNHAHPLFKFKTPFIADNKKELYTIMTTINNHNKDHYIKLSNNLYKNELAIGTNLKKKIHINITNNSQYILTKNTFWLIAKDYNDLELQYDRVIKEEIQLCQNIIVPINIVSKSKEKEYKIHFQLLPSVNHYLGKLYSNSMTINVKVIDDEEEKMLSCYFAENPEIQLLPKELMQQLYQIDNKKITHKTPTQVYELLKKSKWNIKKVIEKLKAG